MKRIVVLDSGIDRKHNAFIDRNIEAYELLYDKNNKIIVSNEQIDNIGHGTAISSIIIHNSNDEIKLLVYKIFDDYFISSRKLIDCLKYIFEFVDCDIINLSLGIESTDDIFELKEIINKLTNKGIIIVSAFDNNGGLSYPALFEDVIGVDSVDEYCKNNEFTYIENSPINILGKGTNQRTAWKDNSYKVVRGNSFACAYVTSILANILDDTKIPFSEVLLKLKKNASKVICYDENYSDEKELKIENALLFPFNKEMHSIVRFNHLLNFKIYKVCDIHETGNINKKLKKYNSELIIENILNIDWTSNFDTVIIGHMDKINAISKADLRYNVILKAIKYGKNIVSFDNLDYYYMNDKIVSDYISQGKIYCPKINSLDIPHNQRGKLYDISTPIIGVFGTGSKQGKFTLQMELRDRFIKNGYKVGQIGTEPSSILFGMDKVYPMGYNSSVEITRFDSVQLINKYLHEISMKGTDIIIGGSQSNCVPIALSNEEYIPLKQLDFIVGLNPDVVILLVNGHDEYEYIKRTIDFIQSFTFAKVLAVVIFPLKLKNGWSGVNGVYEIVSNEEIKKLNAYIQELYGINVFELNDSKQIDEIYNIIIEYFSE